MNITFEEFIIGLKARLKHKRMVRSLPNKKSTIKDDIEPDIKELEAIESSV